MSRMCQHVSRNNHKTKRELIGGEPSIKDVLFDTNYNPLY